MFKVLSVFLFASTTVFAQAQFLKCEGISNSAPFSILIHAGEGHSLVLDGTDVNAAIEQGTYVHLGTAEMQGKSEDCLYSVANESGALSLKMPACQLQAGSTLATIWSPELSLNAPEVSVQCSWESGDEG